MENHPIILLLIFSVGISQQLPKVFETYENGNLKSITYHKETKTGTEKVKYEVYHYTGQKAAEGTYKDGKEDGLWTYWYENGQKKSERLYRDNKIIGEWTEFELFFYDNGQKKSEGTYKVGRPDGFWTFWYENGQKKCEGIIREFPIRNWTFYNEDGSIDRVVEVDKKHSQKIMVEIYGMEYQKNYKSMGK